MIAMLVFSVLSPLEDAMRWLLFRFHDNVGLSWAWSIVATTLVVRILLVPLMVRQIHSMQSLQRHAPEMKEIQKKYKGDREKLNQELMKFYKENHINPAASCLPMVAQFPVFIALYVVLRHFKRYLAPGADLSWLHIVPDITAHASSHWSGYLLIGIYVVSQAFSSWYMSVSMDRAQRLLMTFVMPLVLLSFAPRFPVGLVLYWMTTNLWTVGQGLITRRLMPKTKMPSPFAQRRTSRTVPATAPAVVPDKPQPKRPQQPQVRRVKRKKRGHGR